MTTEASTRKRQQLLSFIHDQLAPKPPVQAVVVVGSVASGMARDDSDIDAVIFLEPLDLYIVPAESIWWSEDGRFHSSFTENSLIQEHGLQLDFKRFDLAAWRAPARVWPEPLLAELSSGWVAYDRRGEIGQLLAERTRYDDTTRQERLDEALVWLDLLLSERTLASSWSNLGALIAHDRLQAAYEWLVQALFAYNRRWRGWRNREMGALLELPWLPVDFEQRMLAVLLAAPGYSGYEQRAAHLQKLRDDVIRQLQATGDYGQQPVQEGFMRMHEEPGRSWNMDQWMATHRSRWL
jgi:hypothetical protein